MEPRADYIESSPISAPTSGRASQLLHSRYAFWGLLVILLGAVVWYHFRADNNFPVPWPDEVYFTWQANAIAEHFTVFAPELNPDRPIMWVPPGYLAALAAAIKLFGLSLSVVRTFSLFWLLCSVLLLALIARRYIPPALTPLMMVPFFLGPPAIASGNVGRMESMVIAVSLAGFLALQHRHTILGLCLLLLTPLIHPNGIYFVPFGILAALLLADRPLAWRLPKFPEWLMIFAVLLAWCGYAYLAKIHWAEFSEDMSYQFHRKLTRHILDESIYVGSVLGLLAVSAAVCFGVRRRAGELFLLAIALPAWWIATSGMEMWYHVFFALAFCLLAIFAVSIILRMHREISSPGRRRNLTLIVAVLSLVVLIWNVRQSVNGSPLVYLQPGKWSDMSLNSGPYATTEDIAELSRRLAALPKDRTITLGFYPPGDALYFTSLRSQRLQFRTTMFTRRHSDLYLLHFSKYTPEAFQKFRGWMLEGFGVDLHRIEPYLLYAREETERWYLVPPMVSDSGDTIR